MVVVVVVGGEVGRGVVVGGEVLARGMEEMVRWSFRVGCSFVGEDGEGVEVKGEVCWGIGGGGSLAAASSQAVRAEWSTGQAEGGVSLGVVGMLFMAATEEVVRLCWILVVYS